MDNGGNLRRDKIEKEAHAGIWRAVAPHQEGATDKGNTTAVAVHHCIDLKVILVNTSCIQEYTNHSEAATHMCTHTL